MYRRYGNLTDFSKTIATYADIARATGINERTVRRIILHYHNLGDRYDADSLKRAGRKRKLPPHVERELASWELLNEMRFLGLEKRLVFIRRRYGV